MREQSVYVRFTGQPSMPPVDCIIYNAPPRPSLLLTILAAAWRQAAGGEATPSMTVMACG